MKMNKSAAEDAPGVIRLLDGPDVVRRKIARAVTDSDTGPGAVRHDPDTKPGVSNLLELVAACTGTSVEEAADGVPTYGALKKVAADAVVAVLEPLQRRYGELADDPAYVRRLERALERFDAYMTAAFEPASWPGPGGTTSPISPSHPVAYFCAEYGVHESLRVYSGGLGILAGDHLKSASDLNLPLIAVGLFYRMGYAWVLYEPDEVERMRGIVEMHHRIGVRSEFHDERGALELLPILRGGDPVLAAVRDHVDEVGERARHDGQRGERRHVELLDRPRSGRAVDHLVAEQGVEQHEHDHRQHEREEQGHGDAAQHRELGAHLDAEQAQRRRER